jgi:uncharacterized membrane protein YkvA (DUF1232 family)
MENLKARAKRLKAEVMALYYAAQDPRVPWTARGVMLLALGYALSPIDLIPDFIPVLGYLDDLLILPALIALALRLVPAEVMAAARERAAREPVSPKKNWLFASLFALFWIAALAAVVLALVRAFD